MGGRLNPGLKKALDILEFQQFDADQHAVQFNSANFNPQ